MDLGGVVLSHAVIDFLSRFGLNSGLIVFIISCLPLLELRLGLVAAAILKVPFWEAAVICYIGNILPIPFILLFIKQIFKLMRRFGIFPRLVDWLEARADKKGAGVVDKKYMGLFLFVALPIPGTGAWMGALIASLLNMDVKRTFLTIAAGVLCCEVIMLTLTYFIPGMFGF